MERKLLEFRIVNIFQFKAVDDVSFDLWHVSGEVHVIVGEKQHEQVTLMKAVRLPSRHRGNSSGGSPSRTLPGPGN